MKFQVNVARNEAILVFHWWLVDWNVLEMAVIAQTISWSSNLFCLPLHSSTIKLDIVLYTLPCSLVEASCNIWWSIYDGKFLWFLVFVSEKVNHLGVIFLVCRRQKHSARATSADLCTLHIIFITGHQNNDSLHWSSYSGEGNCILVLVLYLNISNKSIAQAWLRLGNYS